MPFARRPASLSFSLWPGKPLQWVRWALFAIAAVFYALHFLHLTADFPNNSPWSDWSKYTDEGWYSDAAVRHFLFGHWYLAGDFNPAVALPVWPLLEAAVFRFTGVSLAAARALAVVVFGVTLLALWRLLARFETAADRERRSLAAPLAVLFLAVSPFVYAFEREAILEPLLAALAVLALLAASYCAPFPRWEQRPRTRFGTLRALFPPLALTLLLPAMVLTKPTALTILPAVAYLLWDRAGHRLWPALTLALPPMLLGAAIWLGYLVFLVRPHFREDYQYLFDANAYTGFQLEPLATVVFHTVADGNWIGGVLYPLFFGLLAILLFARPRFFRNPLVPALLLWVGAYFVFLGYHNNLQPRYYLLLAVPATALVAMALEELRSFPQHVRSQRRYNRPARLLLPAAVALCIGAVALPDALQQLRFVLHPEYTYVSAAQALARTVRADRTHSPLVLSVSGSDLTLMTGLPSIDDDFGTLDLDQRVALYRPGWYAAWNELDDDKMDAIRPLFRVTRVAAFPALDDPDRNLLILYRLDPGGASSPRRKPRRRVPRPLRTRHGQQPTTTQLQH